MGTAFARKQFSGNGNFISRDVLLEMINKSQAVASDNIWERDLLSAAVQSASL